MTIPQFEDWRENFLRAGASDGDIRAGILGIIDRKTGLAEVYKSDPVSYDIERDIGDRLRVFGDRRHGRNLGLLRRFFLRRFAFGRAWEVDQSLKGIGAKRGWLWWLDYLLPRVGLAQILGLGVILGASGVFGGLGEIANKGPALFVSVVLGACLGLVWLLLFLHVRTRIAGPAARVRRRACSALGRSMVWPAVAFGVEWLMRTIMHKGFPAWRTALVNAAALLFAVLSQFYFAKDASMGDPL